MASWSSLPCDLLSEIAQKLPGVEDFVYFAAVCRPFFVACAMVKQKWSPRMPWLLLAENTNNNPDCRRKVFTLTRDRCYELKLSQTFGTRCWGSSCGLVVTIDLDRQLYLYNPLTQTHVLLPPQPTMPNQMEEDIIENEAEDELIANYEILVTNDEPESEWVRRCFVEKAIVLEVSHGDYLVLAIHGRDGMKALAFARPGDKEWTSVFTNKKHHYVYDVTWDGQRVYILYCDGNLGYFDIIEAYNSQPLTALDYLDLHPPPAIKERLFYGDRVGFFGLYLIESLGDLLMVIRYVDYIEVQCGFYTTNFEVYRHSHKFGLEQWEQLDDLGNMSLFVGTNHSMAVHATAIRNFKYNSIYFTDDFHAFWDGHCSTDMGVFSMASKEIEPFYNGEDMDSKFCTPLWFMPRL